MALNQDGISDDLANSQFRCHPHPIPHFPDSLIPSSAPLSFIALPYLVRLTTLRNHTDNDSNGGAAAGRVGRRGRLI